VADRQWPDEIEPLIRVQIREPLAEISLRAQIPSLTTVSDAVSRRVRAQYEEHPYPRWVRAETMASVFLPSFIAQLGGKVAANDATFRSPDVLIAGCGTGQQVVTAASRYRDARILAVDISRVSLAHAKRRSQLLGIENVQFVQADILELGALGHRFHVIESSGVLHHLADPLAGWRTLSELLRPGGLMNIGLYSEVARQSIVAAQAWIAERGSEPSADHIRRCRAEILAMPPESPLAAVRDSLDFYNLSSCRDLLFHAQEHRFTLAQIRSVLASLGLNFLRFDVPNTSGYRLRFPDDPAMTSLDNWEAYERDHPATFSGMYQFWLQKNGGFGA
jgi:2-polyprenyl-3-methyl-5-hydroxy-6-metoxy-1,4-benzoquinol methylase